jgi:hypothetical protein
MKAIKHIWQLKAEQQKLKQRQEHLESIIQKDWKELQGHLRPANLAKDIFTGWVNNKNSIYGIGLNGFSGWGAAILAARLLGRAGTKIAKMFSAR